jgi:Meiotically up-regulated gene 113
MVYFMKRPNGDIKIGYSENPKTRKGQLQCDWGYDLEMIGVMAGGKAKEAEIHDVLRCYRIDPRQEWFRPTDTVLSYIETLVKENPAPPPSEWRTRGRKGYLMVTLNADEMAQLDRIVDKLRRETGIRVGRGAAVRWLIFHAE